MRFVVSSTVVSSGSVSRSGNSLSKLDSVDIEISGIAASLGVPEAKKFLTITNRTSS